MACILLWLFMLTILLYISTWIIYILWKKLPTIEDNCCTHGDRIRFTFETHTHKSLKMRAVRDNQFFSHLSFDSLALNSATEKSCSGQIDHVQKALENLWAKVNDSFLIINVPHDLPLPNARPPHNHYSPTLWSVTRRYSRFTATKCLHGG